MAKRTHNTELDAIVVGAGFSGLYMLYKLRDQLGLSVKAFETAPDVGGTWFWNRYPGARCDSESYVYCYSFSPELLQEWDWSGKYPKQAEIHSYLRHVADRFDLRRDIQFETRVDSARYVEDRNVWEVETSHGETYVSTYLITAVGILAAAPHVPDLDGLDDFAGQWYHTGAWPQEGVDVTGKRVAVIGTGSSGAQAVPVIAEQAERLYVMQRGAHYVIPARHETVDRRFLDQVKRRYDELWEEVRWSVSGYPWRHVGRSALDVSDEERQATFESLWREGGLRFVFGSYKDLLTNRESNEFAAEFIRNKVREIVRDREVAKTLIPVDHPVGSRRPIVAEGYYEAFNRDNVDLVDLKSDPIRHISSRGIVTAANEYDVDVIVLATGFDAVTGPFRKIDIVGRRGQRLGDKWGDGPETYLGIATSGFPNMFTIAGPGSTFGNYPVSMEHHVEWIANCIQFMRSRGYRSIEPTREAELWWMRHVNEQVQKTVVAGTDSWWTGANIPGKPKSVLFYLGSFGLYRKMVDEVARNGYEGFSISKESSLADL